jgi:hypothetical protein
VGHAALPLRARLVLVLGILAVAAAVPAAILGSASTAADRVRAFGSRAVTRALLLPTGEA